MMWNGVPREIPDGTNPRRVCASLALDPPDANRLTIRCGGRLPPSFFRSGPPPCPSREPPPSCWLSPRPRPPARTARPTPSPGPNASTRPTTSSRPNRSTASRSTSRTATPSASPTSGCSPCTSASAGTTAATTLSPATRRGSRTWATTPPSATWSSSPATACSPSATPPGRPPGSNATSRPTRPRSAGCRPSPGWRPSPPPAATTRPSGTPGPRSRKLAAAECAASRRDALDRRLVGATHYLAEACDRLDDRAAALAALRDALPAAARLDDRPAQLELLAKIARALAALGKSADASDAFAKAPAAHEKWAPADRLTAADLLAQRAAVVRTRKRDAEKSRDEEAAAGFAAAAADLDKRSAAEYLAVLADPAKGIPEVAGRLTAFWKLQNLYRRDRQFRQALRVIGATDAGVVRGDLVRPKIDAHSGGLELLTGRYRAARDLLREAVPKMEAQRPLNLTELAAHPGQLGHRRVDHRRGRGGRQVRRPHRLAVCRVRPAGRRHPGRGLRHPRQRRRPTGRLRGRRPGVPHRRGRRRKGRAGRRRDPVRHPHQHDPHPQGAGRPGGSPGRVPEGGRRAGPHRRPGRHRLRRPRRRQGRTADRPEPRGRGRQAHRARPETSPSTA